MSAIELRVQLGCGLTAPEGWINIDRSPNVLLDRLPSAKRLLGRIGVLTGAQMVRWPSNVTRRDVTKGLPFPSRSVAAIYSSHMLEHLYLDQAEYVLCECRRVLRGGGVLRLALPDAARFARDLLDGRGVDNDDPGLSFTRAINAHPLTAPSLLKRFLNLFGGSYHRWQPVESLVRTMLWRAGFQDVAVCTFRAGRLPDLELLEHRADSLFVEAATAID